MSLNPLGVAIVVALTAFAGYALFYGFKRPAQAQSEVIRKATSINAQFMAEIEQYLKHRGVCDQIEMTGSIYEDLNVDEDDNIQLEALIIRTISGSDIAAEKINDKRDCASLRFLHGRKSSPAFDQVLSHILGSLIGTRYLDAEMTADMFERELYKCSVDSKQMSGKVKLIRNGPVLHMEVYPDSWLLSWGSRLYTMDIVPAYKLDEELYEWRPIKGDEMPATMTWHRTFVLQERQMLFDGAKMVLRVLEFLQKRESGFGNFTSYQLKTAVLHEIDTNQDWREIMFWKRLADVIERLKKCLTEGKLPHFFLRQINLLSNMSSNTLDHLHDRIQHIPTDESELRRFLQR